MDLDCELNGLSTKELHEKINTYHYDLAYEKALGATAHILRDEENRQMRVKSLLVEDEKNELNRRLDVEARKIEMCQDANLRTQFELTAAMRSLEKVNSDLRASSRQNDALNAEITSLSNKSAVLSADNVTLESEVASLTSAVQNLKSQTGVHQAVLVEKLALERRLSSLQQEVETSKRSTEIAQAAQQVSQLENERLQHKVRSLEAELDEERNQRLQADERSEKVSSVWETKYTTLEQRSDSFRAKLRVTIDQLKACQAELHDVRANGPTEPDPFATGPGRNGFAKPLLKRNSVQQQDADSMIGTPGDMPAAKKTKRGLTLPGDKSTFSITPYLNRASSVALNSPPSVDGHVDGFERKQRSYDHLDDQGEPDEPVINTLKGSTSISKPTRPRSKAMQPKPHAIGSKGNTSMKTSLMHNSKISLSLEDVSEIEENDLNDPLLIDKAMHKSAEKEKRKRKVLTGRLHKPALKDDQHRKLGSAGREQMAPPSASTFGAISPLKRKRKPLAIDPQDTTT